MNIRFIRYCLMLNAIVAGLFLNINMSYAGAEATEQPRESSQEKMFNLVVKRLDSADTVERKREIANDLMTYGDLLDDRIDAALKMKFYATIVKNFEPSNDELLTAKVAEAQLSIAMVLGNNHRDKEALLMLDAFLAKFGQFKQPPYLHLTCLALIGKGHFLSNHEGKYEDALAAYSEIVKKSNEFSSEDISMHHLLTEALFLMAEIQEKQNKIEEATLSLTEIEKRYANTRDDNLKQQVENAVYKRNRILNEAKKSN